MPDITKEPFGVTEAGEPVYCFTLKAGDIEVRVINVGCAVKDILVPDKDGIVVDVNLGYSDLSGYEANPGFLGCICGRVANRIDGATFELDGTRYNVSKNDPLGNNMCHGGFKGFSRQYFDWSINGTKLVLTYLDKDGSEGFLGDVTTTVTYELTAENGLMMDYQATTTKPTPIDLSNHFLFNLAGHSAGNIRDHLVTVTAGQLIEFNDKFIPTGEIKSLSDTVLDFRHPVLLDDILDKLPREDGLVHAYILPGNRGERKLVARFPHNLTGLKGSEITLSGQFEKLFGHVNNRISVIEESVLKLTTTVTSFIDSMTRQPRPNEMDRLNEKLDRLERDNESNRNQVSELIKQNGILKRKIEELESRNSLKDIEWRQRNRKLAEDVETTRLNAKLTVEHHRDEMSSKLRLAEGQLQQKTSSNLELEDKIDNLQEKISDLSSENKAYKDRIKDKDILINNLQDRLQTMKYDSEGGSWIVYNRVNSSPTRDSASDIFPTSTSQTSATDTEEHPPTDDIVLLHDSICKHVNMSQLTAGSDLKGSEIKCSTLEAVSETVRRINKSVPHVVIHVGVNDLRKPHSSVDDVFSKYCQTVHDVSSKSDKITLSLLLPCDEQPLCSNIMALNNLIITKFLKTEKNSKISVCMNDNFTSAGILNSKLFEDSVHINREGTKVLCSNLKRSMNLQNKQAERPGGFRGRQRNSMRNQQNTMGNRPNSIPRHNGQKSGQSQMADQLAQALLGLMSQ